MNPDESIDGQLPVRKSEVWLLSVWRSVRPRLIHLVADFVTFTFVWSILWLAHKLTSFLALDSGLAPFLIGCHETAVTLGFVWICLASLRDLARTELRDGS